MIGLKEYMILGTDIFQLNVAHVMCPFPRVFATAVGQRCSAKCKLECSLYYKCYICIAGRATKFTSKATPSKATLSKAASYSSNKLSMCFA